LPALPCHHGGAKPDGDRDWDMVMEEVRDRVGVTVLVMDTDLVTEMVLVLEMDDKSFTSPDSVVSTWAKGREGAWKKASE
jgi:hypothetical protein